MLTEQIPAFVDISHVNPFFAAVFGGILIGVGMLMMFRHSSSLGGIGIMAFFLQQRFNIRAGFFQLSVDSVILLCALQFIEWHLVLISILAALCLNMVISLNHRPERYAPVSKSKNNSKSVSSADANNTTLTGEQSEHLDNGLHPQNS